MLARLDLTPEEMKLYQQQLSDILDHVAQLQKLETGDISPTSSVLPPQARLREDTVKTSLTPDQVMDNAPEKETNQFKVPPVFE